MKAVRQHRLQDPWEKQAKCVPGSMEAVPSKTHRLDLLLGPRLRQVVTSSFGLNEVLLFSLKEVWASVTAQAGGTLKSLNSGPHLPSCVDQSLC